MLFRVVQWGLDTLPDTTMVRQDGRWAGSQFTHCTPTPQRGAGLPQGSRAYRIQMRLEADILGQFSGLPFSSMPVGLTFVFFKSQL